MATHTQKRHQWLLFEQPGILTAQDIYDNASQSLLNVLCEDRRFERKPPGIHAAALADYLSMFANTGPDGGVISVGINDDRTIAGCSALPANQLNNLERAGDTHCPGARYETRRLPVTNAQGKPDFLLLLRIHYSDKRLVETTKGHAYIRRGDSKKRLTDDEKRELRSSRGELQLEIEPCPTFAFPDAFNMSLIREFYEKCVAARQLSTTSHSIEDVLELRHLGKRDHGRFIPNLACVLLFAQDPTPRIPGCKIRFLRFEGEEERTGERYNAVKDLWLEGPIISLIPSAEQAIDAQLRDFSRLGRDGKFYTAPEYPKAAWYEAIVNACVHRSYGLTNMNIFVKMFDDRLEIESPGGFPGIVTADNIYEMHDPRNPFLMEALFYLEFVKCAREGARRMRDSMIELALPAPEFSEREVAYGLVRVILRNNIKQRKVWIDSDASAVIGEVLFQTLTEHERRIVNFVAENGSINVSQLQRLTGRSWPSAKTLLGALADRGILRHVVRSHLDRDPQAHFVLYRPPAD